MRADGGAAPPAYARVPSEIREAAEAWAKTAPPLTDAQVASLANMLGPALRAAAERKRRPPGTRKRGAAA